MKYLPRVAVGQKNFSTVLALIALLALTFCIVITGNTRAAEDPALDNNEGILVVDVCYDLLFALGEYHELTREERQEEISVNARIVPVIERIISGFRGERDRYQTLAIEAGQQPTKERLEKINSHIIIFDTELTIRAKELEFETLRRKQRRLFMEKGR